MKNIAIILAGGSGSRLGNDTPKQFLQVAGKQIIEHSIDAFHHVEEIDEICIVTRADYLQAVEQLVQKNHYHKVQHILPGGKERYDSSMASLRTYTNDEDNLLFHDAVRPLVTERIIHDCILALQSFHAVDVAVPTTDTIIEVDENDCIQHIPNRANLRNVQTPQCFKRGTIAKAYQLALADPLFCATDDCGVVRKYLPSEPIHVVNGETFNIKLTYAEDLVLLEKLLTNKTI